MSKMNEKHITAIAAEEKAKKREDKLNKEAKEKSQAAIKRDGARAERLKDNPDFKWLMSKIVNRGKEITDAQSGRLINIGKLTEFGNNTVNNIVSNQIKEAIIAGEFIGLKSIKTWIETAIKDKERVLQQEEDENEE